MPRPMEKQRPAAPTDWGHELTKGFAGRRLRYRAYQLAGTCGFSRSDRADLEQDLRIAVLQAYPKFDPDRGPWNVFVFTVIERTIASLFTARRVHQRMTEFESDSLSTLMAVDDLEETTLAQLILPDDQSHLTGHTVRHHEEESDRVADTALILAQLSPELRRVAERLQEITPAQLARELGIPRRTLRSQMEVIRRAFLEHGYVWSSGAAAQSAPQEFGKNVRKSPPPQPENR